MFQCPTVSSSSGWKKNKAEQGKMAHSGKEGLNHGFTQRKMLEKLKV
jgi:hypothetical protein